MSRRFLSRLTALLVVIVGGAVVLPPAPAQAATTLLTCAGSQVQTYAPGLTLAQRPTTTVGTTTYSTCLGNTLTKTGAAVRTFVSNQSCLLGTLVAPFDFIIVWDGLLPSTVRATSVTLSRTLGETKIVLLGTVTAGQYFGASYVETTTLLNTDPSKCLSEPGVAAVSGLVSVAVTSAV
jgi:hypothetical protein